MLVGASRKGFIGKIVGGTCGGACVCGSARVVRVVGVRLTFRVFVSGDAETKPKLRGWGTAATSTAAVAGTLPAAFCRVFL